MLAMLDGQNVKSSQYFYIVNNIVVDWNLVWPSQTRVKQLV